METQRTAGNEQKHQPDYLDIDRKFMVLLVEVQAARREVREVRDLIAQKQEEVPQVIADAIANVQDNVSDNFLKEN